MARRKEPFEGSSPVEREFTDKEADVVKVALIGVFLVIELLLLITIPPAAVIIAIVLAKFVMPYLKQAGVFRTQEKKATAKVEKKVNWKESGQKAAKKYVSRVTEAGVKEKEFKSHPHTPIAYSYDSCAKEKRLEQIRTLKNAGLLTEAEYKQRRSDILAEK